MKLTGNFTLEELTYTNPEIFKRFGIKNEPNDEVIQNLKLLAENVLQPIRDHFKVPIIISSGYRCQAYNEKIGSKDTSQHIKGQAADIDQDGTKITNKQVFDFILKNLEFDQLIWELGDLNNPAWVHVSYQKKNRKMITRAVRKNGKVVYQIMPV